MCLFEENKKQLKNWALLVKRLREAHGLSQKKMSELMGVSVASLRRIEKGEIPGRMSVQVILNIHKAFGIRPQDQFQDTDM